MIAKKNPGVDLERKRVVLFNIGLLTAGAFTLAAFTYSAPLEEIEEERAAHMADIQYHAELEEAEKEEPVVEEQTDADDQDQSQELGSEDAISEKSKAAKNTQKKVKSGHGKIGKFGRKMPLTKNRTIKKGGGIEKWPDIEASYVGGHNEMVLHMAEVQEYPDIDIQMGNQGTVYVSFVVETDGSITGVDILRELTPTLDREAKRIVRSFPNWNPGKNKFGPVRTRVRLPIKFILEG